MDKWKNQIRELCSQIGSAIGEPQEEIEFIILVPDGVFNHELIKSSVLKTYQKNKPCVFKDMYNLMGKFHHGKREIVNYHGVSLLFIRDWDCVRYKEITSIRFTLIKIKGE